MLRDLDRVVVWDGDGVMPRDRLLAEACDAVGLYCMLTDRVDRDLLGAAPDLRAVSNMAVGVDNIDVVACTEAGIPVGHTPGVLTEATADMAFALLLAAARRVGEGIDHVRSDQWGEWQPDLLLGQDVSGSTLGIVGMGRIGAAVARRGAGFGMSLVYASPGPKVEVEKELGATRHDLSGVLKVADHVVVTASLNAGTYHLMGEQSFRLMKSTATFVNISRGALVDTAALVRALESGAIAAAGLDVTDPEPMRADHPLAKLPNCVVTPHLGSASHKTRAAMAELAARNLIAALNGNRMEACANPAVYDAPPSG
jgi:lactate dehydrogenase-like 2-hydroxyacid dehydrogenase